MPVKIEIPARTLYRLKPGSRFPPKKAQIYGECLQELAEQHGGRLDADMVLSASRSSRSPIHECFEWDDSKAAEEYRRVQARELLRAIVIVQKDSGLEVRAFENVVVRASDQNNDVEGSYYVPIQDIIPDENLMKQVLQEAVNYLKWFRKKYENLKQLGTVHRAIDKVIARF